MSQVLSLIRSRGHERVWNEPQNLDS
jgi:hypothetical protein